MLGRLTLSLSLLSLLGAAGCKSDGTLQVTWDFLGVESPASGCGQHGVDSILIAGLDTGGDTTRTVALCTPGFRNVSVPDGTWSVVVSMLDAQGATLPGSDPNGGSATGTATVTTDTHGAISVHLDPPPACSDGVDNDHDGRVDSADANCQNGGTAE